MNILMVSADVSVVAGEKGPFYYMLEEFHHHFQRIDVIGLKPTKVVHKKVFENVYLHPASRGKWYQPFFIRDRGIRLLRERSYSFAISHDYNVFYNGLGTYLLHRKTKLPYISEIHHVPGHPRAATFRERIDRHCTRLYARWVQKHALAIRVVNAKELPHLLIKWGVHPDKIKVLYSIYLDRETFHPEKKRKEYDLIFCGRLVANKGIFILLEALKILKRSRPTIQLLVVGRGPLKGKIDGFLQKGDLLKNVRFLPWVSEAKELAELYCQARILVCSSFNEGGPRVTLESMACGTPVISTPVGLMPELIREGENGMLFRWDASELARKIDALLSDPALYGRMVKGLEKTVAPFAKKRVITHLAEGFKALVHEEKNQA